MYFSLYSCPQETTATIVFRLLDRVVAAELIPSTIAKYIAPYMMHHGLDRDTMLLQYIEVTLTFVFTLAKRGTLRIK